jgi:hypothetical protein
VANLIVSGKRTTPTTVATTAENAMPKALAQTEPAPARAQPVAGVAVRTDDASAPTKEPATHRDTPQITAPTTAPTPTAPGASTLLQAASPPAQPPPEPAATRPAAHASAGSTPRTVDPGLAVATAQPLPSPRTNLWLGSSCALGLILALYCWWRARSRPTPRISLITRSIEPRD